MIEKLNTEATDRLVRALLSMRTKDEMLRFLEDLCTIREVQDLAQRLEVAQMLSDKVTYAEIAKQTGVSTATITRVNRSLTYGAGGYKAALERLGEVENA
ncbi:MAG: YerC/YecD family TrpR-related protein [Christensenellales bacterium]|jgi:TrpR-related protein YerC/YecD